MKKFLSHEIFYTHAVTDVTDNYQVWILRPVVVVQLKLFLWLSSVNEAACQCPVNIAVSCLSVISLLQIQISIQLGDWPAKSRRSLERQNGRKWWCSIQLHVMLEHHYHCMHFASQCHQLRLEQNVWSLGASSLYFVHNTFATGCVCSLDGVKNVTD